MDSAHDPVTSPASLEAVLDRHARIARALADFHAAHGLHGELRPAAVVASSDGRLAIAPPDTHARQAADALRYASPAVAGRLGARDPRDDLYSLGVMLYEDLAGHPPFTADDALTLAHAHMASPAPRLERLVPGLPPTVAEIAHKLLEKPPSRRYSTAAALAADLERGRDELAANGAIVPFELGQLDQGTWLGFPERLYGRSAELAAVVEVIDRGGGLCLVSGDPGVGKSALMQAARSRALARGALFAESRFDEHRAQQPYAAVVQPISMLLQQVLSRPEAEIAEWRATMQEALGDLAPVLTGLVPELVALLGPQPPAEVLGGRAGESRLHRGFERLIGALATGSRPVVCFADDMQWADTASVRLLGHLALDVRPAHVVLIAAYRDSELTDDNRLGDLIEQLRGAYAGILSELRLHPLSADDLTDLIADTWPGIEHPAELAELVLRKTDGNPFYARQFLHALVDRQHLRYDPEARTWRWEAAAHQVQELSDSAVELLARRVAELPAPTREVLRVGAAIGGEFPVWLVAAVLGGDEVDVLGPLAPALADELIIPLADSGTLGMRFTHDRVLHAAYGDAHDDPPAAELHVRIAEVLATSDAFGDHLFATADQYGLGRAAVIAPDQRLRVAATIGEAGTRALRSPAYSTAARYFDSALELLPDDAWEHQYELAFELTLAAAEADSALGRDTRFDAWAAELLAHARPGLDRVRAFARQALHFCQAGRPMDAMEATMAALNEADVVVESIPEALARVGADRSAQLAEQIDRFYELLAGRPVVETLTSLPPVADPVVRAVFELGAGVVDTLAVADLPTLQLGAIEVVNLALQYGGHPAIGPIVVGMATAARTRAETDELCRAGLALAAPDPRYAAHAEIAYLRFEFSWTNPLREVLERVDAAYAAAMASHDTVYAEYALSLGVLARFCLGNSMSEIWQADEHRTRHTRHYGATVISDTTTALAEAAKAIAGFTGGLTEFDPGFDLAALEHRYRGVDLVMRPLRCAQITMFALAREHHRVLALAGDYPTQSGAPILCDQNTTFWVGVAHAALAHPHLGSTDAADARHVDGLDRAISELAAVAAQVGHAQVGHRLMFLRAERLRLTGGNPDDLYNAATGSAVRAGFWLEDAYILERYGDWLSTTGVQHRGRARMAWETAIAAYRACEAYALVGRLNRTLAMHFDQAILPPTLTNDPFDRLDTQTILRAVQTLTDERDLDALLSRMLTIMVASTGAERGVIAHRTDDEPTIEARTPAAPDVLPLGMIRYVLNTGQTLRIGHAESIEGADAIRRFGAADVAATAGVAAILCVPIGRRPPYRRALYLDHRSLPDVFAPRGQQRVLEWLVEQAGISVDNAEMYDDLEQLVQARTRELNDANQLLQRQGVDLRRAKDDAEAATRAKSEFLANVSHEVRTPMNAILGLTELMLTDERDAARRDRLGKIASSAGILMGIIDDILDYSKVEAGKLDIEQTVFSLVDVVTEAVHLAQVTAGPKGLPVNLSIAPSLPPHLLGDPLRVGQVVRNLLSNAVKFTSEGAVDVTVEASPAPRAAGEPSQVDVVLKVSDTGVGMSASTLTRLFLPFSQADASTTRRFGGTGLGLAISAHLLELMGGDISVDSTEGAGTEFTVRVRFEVAEHGPAARATPGSVEPSLDGVRVLLVEDNELNREVASMMLATLGATVVTAEHGEDAVAQLAAGTPGDVDLVLMDCQMPVLDGYAATRRIRELPGRGGLTILAMTANAMAGDRARALDSGMNGHVAKPVTTAQLAEAAAPWLTPPATPDELRAAAPALYGFDVEGVLDRVPDVDMLRQLLHRFRDHQTGVIPSLREALAGHDLARIRDVAHRLAGTAGMLGATAIDSGARHVMALADSTVTSPELATGIDQLAAELRRTFATLALLWPADER